jgi:TonB-linked SusC/RagA family outer membrane protein
MSKMKQQLALEKGSFLKFMRIMRLMAALLFVASLHVAAAGHTQENVTLNLKSVELRKALINIEKKSSYRFLFNEALLANKPRVDVQVVDMPVTSVLDQIFRNTGIAYKIMSTKLVVLTDTKEEANLEQLQDIRVTGRVISSEGNPVAGASIVVKGSRTGTTTDANGNFSLSVPDNATLVFSSVGFEAQEVAIGGRTTINVTLQTSTRAVDAIVVIGYGTASRRDLTGSITKVAGKEVSDKPNTNPIASLQGKVAGLSVVNSGTPGQAPDIRIRGTSSIGQVHPLYVVDGIFEDNIDYLNPNDIESIEVLKDPSSLAIFGVKGATGVIAITTKKAAVGKTIINFNTSVGFKTLVDKIKMADAATFDLLFKEENANNSVATPDYSALTSNTDWIDVVTRTGKFNNNNLTLATATDKNRFNLSLGYLYDEGIIKHERLDRMSASLSDEVKLNKAIKIGAVVNASRQNNPYDATWVLDAARKAMPQVSAGTKQFLVQNPYGTDSINMNLYSGLDVALQNSGVINPLLELNNNYNKTISTEYRTVGNLYGDISFLKYFNWRSTFYADISNLNKRQYSPLYYAYDPLTNSPYLYNTKTQVSVDNNTWRKFQQDHILTFKKSFSQHNVTATAGFTTYYFGNFNNNGVAKPFTSGNALPIPNDKRFWYLSNGFEDPASTLASSSQSEYSTVSVLGRILYNYQNKYYLNASLRDDASSQLPTQNRHQKFWALGAAWELTKESFMQNQNYFDFLKLKGSVGVLGNQTATDISGTPIPYPFYPNLNTGVGAVFGTNIYNAAKASYQPNPDLKWETVNAWETGVELNAFKNRLHFEANYFSRKTNNLMTYVSRGSLGLDDELINGGSIKNWGEEFSGVWNQNLSKDLNFSLGGNITFLKNKVLTLAKDLPTGVIIRGFQNNGSAEARTLPGYPIGSFYGYVVEGIYQSYADILKSPVASAIGSYRPGDLKFKDISGPNGKPDGLITSDDRTVIGNPTPKFTYGASASIDYKGLSLSVDVNGVYGNQVFRTWGSLESPFQRVNYPAFMINRWHGPGTSNWTPIISQADRFNYNGSTYNIEDGSYFRLRNVQLAYSFGRKLIMPWKLSNLRIYANAQNLKTWKNNQGYTAEFGGDATAFGFDNAGGALPRVITFGLNVTF